MASPRMAAGRSAPTKYWLSTLPADTALATLVETAKLRWRIERDHQELKQELELDPARTCGE
jgi:SRSO17 transposase